MEDGSGVGQKGKEGDRVKRREGRRGERERERERGE